MKNFLINLDNKICTPVYAFKLDFIRICLFSFIIYKLLSRDYSYLAFYPEINWSYDPSKIYNPFNYGFITPKFLYDIFSFHFIHWFNFIPYPSQKIFSYLHNIALVLSILIIFFGRGPKNFFVIFIYIIMTYLIGFVNRSQECEFLLMQGVIFVHCFMSHEDRFTILKRKFSFEKNKEFGKSFSLILIVFIIYYFGSGTTKISDLSLIDWFTYDLRGAIIFTHLQRIEAGLPFYVPNLFVEMANFKVLDYYLLDFINIGPAISYISHLTAPLMFWMRSKIMVFGIFYLAFHVIVFGVAIAFLGNIIMWILLLPIEKFFEKT